jgi:hypothetical protein
MMIAILMKNINSQFYMYGTHVAQQSGYASRGRRGKNCDLFGKNVYDEICFGRIVGSRRPIFPPRVTKCSFKQQWVKGVKLITGQVAVES